MKKHSLKTSLYRVFAGSVFMPFIIISMILVFFYNFQILNGYKTSNRIILQIITNHLDSSLKNSEHFFIQYLFDDNISRFYQYVNKKEIEASEENLYQYIHDSSKYRSSLNNYLTVLDSTHTGIGFIPENANRNNVFYLRKYGNSIIRYQNMQKEMSELYSELDKLSSGEVMFLPGSIMTDCEEYEEYKDEEVFTMLSPVKHIETASRQGYVFLELSKSVFSDLTREITLPNGGGMVIYFPDGTPAYATQESFVSQKDIVEVQSEIMGKRVRIEGKTYYLYCMKDDQYGFTVQYILPQRTILREVNNISFIILLFWFCAMAAAFFIFMNLSRKISASSGRIMGFIQKYRLENKAEREQLPEMSIEEFSDISSALYEMTERITDLVEHEYIWKMNQQIAEYKVMQSEINPHFFNNVMNSMQALNRMGDTKNLEKCILNLSAMFRYTCEHGYDSNILKECGFIKNYLTLEKMRFEERLHFAVEIEVQLEDFQIPKLLLQPLIENAMQHGMPKDGSALSILLYVCSVESRNGESFVLITIANDGTPYQENALYESGRVGINNVRERLFIAYPHSFFWYEHKEKFQTVCNILIPKKEPYFLNEIEKQPEN